MFYINAMLSVISKRTLKNGSLKHSMQLRCAREKWNWLEWVVWGLSRQRPGPARRCHEQGAAEGREPWEGLFLWAIVRTEQGSRSRGHGFTGRQGHCHAIMLEGSHTSVRWEEGRCGEQQCLNRFKLWTDERTHSSHCHVQVPALRVGPSQHNYSQQLSL
uniref:Uncharacterized protein n=1 Tax=Pipistrellus kuhlii TaxID=59472 RepID=A0A7J7WLX2_PIPKU|nr:hypothetical protein mPipKuh1_007963 [Pipistrellus kuhlii]